MIKKFFSLFVLFWSATAFSAETKDLEDVIEEANKAVVNVIAELEGNEQNLGAGIIIGADGYIVTNAHVTEGAKKIFATTSDDKQYEAKLIGSDEKTDIALLKIADQEGFQAAEFADSDEVRVGNTVFAIGNPFGLGSSVSLGIISAKERDIEKGPYDNFLQTDATINQGNSGGPLFNRQGQIVGMNTAIFSADGQYAGIGFATPSNTVKWVADQLKKQGKISRGWLGFGVQKIKSKSENGGYVFAVDYIKENSPAENSGLKVGDIIEEIGEIELNNPRVFSLEISKLPVGTEVPMIIKRDSQELDLILKVAQMPEENTKQPTDEELGLETKADEQKRMQNFAELGIDVAKVANAVEFKQIGIKAYFEDKNREFVVIEVAPKSDALEKGIKVGDKIISVDDTKPFGIEDFQIKLKKAEDKQKIDMTLLSGTNVYSVSLKIGEKNEQN